MDATVALVIESLHVAFEGPRKMQLSGSLLTTTALLELERLLGEVHTYILTANLPSFTIDVRSLNFVNSSAIRVFINWISRASRAHYKLIFVTDPKVTWHRLNFSVLKSLAPQSVEIEGTEGSLG